MKIKMVCYFILALPAIILALIGSTALIICGLIIAAFEGISLDYCWEYIKKVYQLYQKGLELDSLD